MQLVTVGIPVFNGEAHIRHALESLANQTFSDFLVCICDNASKDRTEDICREFAARDSRFTFYRSERNIGLFPNFNRCLGLAQTKYFMWLAHDDLLHPGFLKEAVQRLEEDNSFVLFQSKVCVLSSSGVEFELDLRNDGLAAFDATDRFGALIDRPTFSLEVFGLMRRDILQHCSPIESFVGSDRVLLSRMSLFGRFCYGCEVMFYNRDHAIRSSRSHPKTVVAGGNPRGWISPQALVYLGFVNAIRGSSLSRRGKYRCAIRLLRWWFVNWNGVRLIVDFPAYHFRSVAAFRRFVRRRVLKWDPAAYPLSLHETKQEDR